jgi:glutamyl-tRNA synthetase
LPLSEEKPKHPKNAAVGTKSVTYSSTVFIDQADAAGFSLNEEITLMNWGNAIVRDIARDGTTGMELQLELSVQGDLGEKYREEDCLAGQGGELLRRRRALGL